jgi:hypothetical protein
MFGADGADGFCAVKFRRAKAGPGTEGGGATGRGDRPVKALPAAGTVDNSDLSRATAAPV